MLSALTHWWHYIIDFFLHTVNAIIIKSSVKLLPNVVVWLYIKLFIVMNSSLCIFDWVGHYLHSAEICDV